ncbi:MAG TPA: diacylglycerol kinase family protein [Kofleriaceae bacterium]|jgi:diacylglycerol kinase family enzyme|nr:diacylglycerol kinase family protein [Kofleriaceae bacterium]
MEIGVITNPNSRKNRNRPERVERLQRIVGRMGEVHQTSSVDSIKPVLRDFLRKRARYWVADGGDGALHWMLRMGMEVLQEDEFAEDSVTLPVTLPTKGGTIDFVANNVGIEGDAEGILAMLRRHLEHGATIEETEVDSMVIDGIQLVDGKEVPFRTYGFASAAGGVGQRFYAKYYADKDPNPRTIVKVVANTVLSTPIAMSPLSRLPFGALRTYAKEVFAPTTCKVTLDGMVLPGTEFTGVHIASMSINLGNVLRFFGKADQPGLMNALVGTPSPWAIIRNIPRMTRGQEMKGANVLDRPCRTMTIDASGDELLEPIIDGEYYRNVKRLEFRIGPRVRIPKVVAPKAA